jgi:thiol-disulfide isomerase/thioredoxin
MKLIIFTGEACTNCEKMEPIVQKLEKELKVKFTRLEIWHHPENTKMMLEATDGKCKQIPMFFNKETGDYVCGPTTQEELKAWILKQKQQRKKK